MAKCPNLREVVDKPGFFTGTFHWECSCTREHLHGQYVNNVCRTDNIRNESYKNCNHYKRFGIRN